jgi:molybdopterin-guanine dinucleotide biosynthesis protein A
MQDLKGALTGAVIAGGRSRRMGRDKRLLALEGRTLVERAALLLGSLCDEVLFVSPDPPPVPLPARHVADRFEGLGVLAGIHAALTAARADRVLCIAADTPLLTADWLRVLERACRESGLPCAPKIGGRVHPVPGCYPKVVLPVLETALRAGKAEARVFLREAGARLVGEEEASETGCDPSALTNVNTPEEWERLLAFLEGKEGSGPGDP